MSDRNGRNWVLWVLFVLALFSFFPTSARANTIYFQGFEGADPPGLPAGCSVEPLWESKGNWATRRFGWSPYGVLPHSGSNMAYFNSGSTSIGSAARLVLDGPLDFRGYSEITLTLWVYHDNQRETFDLINLQVSTDGGENWEYLGEDILRYSTSVGWEEVSRDLSAYAGREKVLIGIRGLSYFGNDIHVDDITVFTGGEIDDPLDDSDSSSGCSTGILNPLFLLLLAPLGLLVRKSR